MSDTEARDRLVDLIEWAETDTYATSQPDGMARTTILATAILDAGWRPPAADSEPDEGESAGTSTSEILRYEICIDDSDYVVPEGQVVLVHAHRLGLENRLEVWIQVTEGKLRTQTLRVFGTGQPITAEWRPLGSCVAGPFVWHVCGAE